MLLSEFYSRMIGRFSAKWEKIKLRDYAGVVAVSAVGYVYIHRQHLSAATRMRKPTGQTPTSFPNPSISRILFSKSNACLQRKVSAN
jgi:hypothetical protein